MVIHIFKVRYGIVDDLFIQVSFFFFTLGVSYYVIGNRLKVEIKVP